MINAVLISAVLSALAPTPSPASNLLARQDGYLCPSTASCPREEGCSYTVEGDKYLVACAANLDGGDLSISQVGSLPECLFACSETSGCIAIVFEDRNCYLKNEIHDPSVYNTVVNSGLTSKPHRPHPQAPSSFQHPPSHPYKECPEGFFCPNNDQCTYSGGNKDQRPFTVLCGRDFYGDDLFLLEDTDFGGCVQACAEAEGCEAVSFKGGFGLGTCYLKGGKEAWAVYSGGVDGAYLDLGTVPER
ncbi:hypothetical protein BS50DRAFT_619890 [Corynespora cassiicola Philippines]|uniref:Apple domain-containing protein n=1 Tax=Corynespora cassiicola Philippines TaxID=1448308 RepID=A0A2T2NUY0_CORCC|nr:hypothetical protein BS50DRAFT_619890 [Corynespora cassiicola Philippines]